MVQAVVESVCLVDYYLGTCDVSIAAVVIIAPVQIIVRIIAT